MSATHKVKIYETHLACPVCFPVQVAMHGGNNLSRPAMQAIARPDGALLLRCPRCKKVFEAPSRELQLTEGALPEPPRRQPPVANDNPTPAPADPRGPSTAEHTEQPPG